MSLRNRFRDNIRAYRKQSGVRQEEVADAIGVSVQMYRNYEAGRSWPQPEVIELIAHRLGVSWEKLLGLGLPPDTSETLDAAIRALESLRSKLE